MEFGAIRENDTIKAFGAGILSSFGEMQHMASRAPDDFIEFDPFQKQPKMSYKDGYQQSYFGRQLGRDAFYANLKARSLEFGRPLGLDVLNMSDSQKEGPLS